MYANSCLFDYRYYQVKVTIQAESKEYLDEAYEYISSSIPKGKLKGGISIVSGNTNCSATLPLYYLPYTTRKCVHLDIYAHFIEISWHIFIYAMM